MKNGIERILITEEEIRDRVREVGAKITEDYRGKELAIIGVLKGSVVFMADLMRAVDLPLTIDFMSVSSYAGGTNTTGAVKILKDLDMPVEGKDVLIVEDILDSGLTLSYIMNLMVVKKTASIRLCTFLDKPERRRVPITPNYACFTVPNEFVVGYGLDYAEKYRNLPYIGVLSREVYE